MVVVIKLNLVQNQLLIKIIVKVLVVQMEVIQNHLMVYKLNQLLN
jgi:hypothetical protein